MLKYINTILIIIFLIPQRVFAGDGGIIIDGLDMLEAPMGFVSKDLRLIATDIINQMIGLLGILSVVIIIIAGFMWMLAAGDDEKVSGAKKTLVSGLIGLIIVFTSFSIVDFVLGSLLAIT
jgi:type IV secretion system pilin